MKPATSSILFISLLWSCLCASQGHSAGITIDNFSYGSLEAVRRNWTPGSTSPEVEGDKGKVIFPCDFQGDKPRVCWDRSIDMDLSSRHLVRFDFSCTDPGPLKSIALYFKSGNGWYVWITPVDKRRMTLNLDMKSAGTEGNPAGWRRIDGIRIAVYPSGRPGTAQLYDCSLRADSTRIAVVQGTDSVPAGEKSYAGAVAHRIHTLLDEVGLRHTVITDKDVSAGSLSGTSVAILSYNSDIPSREMAALKEYVGGGGKLIVFYSADSELAGLMGLRLGEYMRAESPNMWRSFTFNSHAPPGTPRVVRQASRNIRLAFPENTGSRIIAVWNHEPETRSYPAWLSSANGFWMTHVLLKGDETTKAIMLLALTGKCDPSQWRAAADHFVARAGVFGPFTGARDALKSIAERATATRQEDRNGLSSILSDARKVMEKMIASHESQAYPETVAAAVKLQSLLTEAYGITQKPVGNEFRGVWNHSGAGLYPGDWEKTCRILDKSGINAILPNVQRPGMSHHRSSVYAESTDFHRHGDQLSHCIDAARHSGIEVHAWKICWNAGSPAGNIPDLPNGQNRFQVDSRGKRLQWLCPSHAANRDLELRALKELAQYRGLTGIHLDYVRFPSRNACFCPVCRADFERFIGRKVKDWPANVVNGSLSNRYTEWRCHRMEEFVRLARDTIREVNPSLKLSAAVYSNYESAIGLGQDWPSWCAHGLLDFVCPMDYTTDTSTFSGLVRNQQALIANTPTRLYPGIGVTASESQLKPEEVIDQILAIRKNRLDGFILFDLTPGLARNTLPVLGIGITSSGTSGH